MTAGLDPILRIVHVLLGAAGLLSGTLAILIPKFRKTPAAWHRWVGRFYAVSMIGMAVVSIPLSIWSANLLLFIIGVATLFWVIGGWAALRRVRKSEPGGARISPSSRLRWHVIWIGSSYIGAWTAFLVNVTPFGESQPWMVFYGAAPTILGSFLIGRTIARLSSSRRRQGDHLSVKPS